MVLDWSNFAQDFIARQGSITKNFSVDKKVQSLTKHFIQSHRRSLNYQTMTREIWVVYKHKKTEGGRQMLS